MGQKLSTINYQLSTNPSLSLRPFGWDEEDLEIDFLQTRRPDLELQILACCLRDLQGEKLDRDFLLNLEIGKQTEYLLTLATFQTSSQLDVSFRCSNCQQQMEVTIPFVEVIRLQQQAENQNSEVEIGSETFSLRKPTGCDRLSWLEHQFADEQSATLAMVQTLIKPEQRSTFEQIIHSEKEWIEILNRSMEEVDPLINFSLESDCPYCGIENLKDFDLGAWALQKLYEMQQQLLITVHRLASHYHWSESEIFAIPPWRRSRYLDLISREESY